MVTPGEVSDVADGDIVQSLRSDVLKREGKLIEEVIDAATRAGRGVVVVRHECRVVSITVTAELPQFEVREYPYGGGHRG